MWGGGQPPAPDRIDGNLPVGQGHAVEQTGQSRVNAQAPGAERAVPVRLAPRPVHCVEVISERTAALPPARRRVAVRRRHHKVSAVDDLGAGEGVGGLPGTGHSCGLRLPVGVRRVLQLVPSGWTYSPLARHCGAFHSGLSVKQWTFSSTDTSPPPLLLLPCFLQIVRYSLSIKFTPPQPVSWDNCPACVHTVE